MSRNPLIARTPRSSGVRRRARCNGFGAAAYSGYRSMAVSGPLPSIGLPQPSRTRPSRPGPTARLATWPDMVIRLPGPIPCKSPRGMRRTRSPRNPTTSAAIGSPAPSLVIRHSSPTVVIGPYPSTTIPTACATLPETSMGSTRSIRWLRLMMSPVPQGIAQAE